MTESPSAAEMAELRAKAPPGEWHWHYDTLWADKEVILEAVDGPQPYGMHTAELEASQETKDFIAAASRFDFATASANERRLAEVEGEVAKLKEIIATHDLCHDLHGKVGSREFAAGCAAEQRKLFGCAPDRDAITAQSAEIERLRAAWDELESRIQSTASTLRGAHVNSNDLLGRVLRDLRNLKSEALAPAGE